MDQASFDRIAAALGTATSRRAGLAAALAAVLGFSSAGAGSRSRRPGAAGPCGARSRAANRCKRNQDCCTNICDIDLGKKNKDRTGRCRCRSNGQQCTEDRNCCGAKMVCLGGICTDPCTSLGETCEPSTVCCAGTCGGVGLTRGRSLVCCLETSESGCTKDADCCGFPSGQVGCVAGVCATTCLALGAICTNADTCCAGICDTPIPPPSLERGSPATACCIPLNSSGCTTVTDCCADSGPITCDSGQCVPVCPCAGDERTVCLC